MNPITRRRSSEAMSEAQDISGHKSGRLLHELVYREAAAAHLVRVGVRVGIRAGVRLGVRVGVRAKIRVSELGLLIELGLCRTRFTGKRLRVSIGVGVGVGLG